ncbi:MAG TPA: hypothetical protein VHM20_08530, partial [Gammaproteobacteria bacterium]|nr:hypothetical protein [Gammaproteobacteria bacterium]
MQFRSMIIDEEIYFFKSQAEAILVAEKISYENVKKILDLYLKKFHEMDVLTSSLKKYHTKLHPKKTLPDVLKEKQHIIDLFLEDTESLFPSVVVEHRVTKKIDQLPLFRSLDLRFLDRVADIYEGEAESCDSLTFTKNELDIFTTKVFAIFDTEVKLKSKDPAMVKKNLVESYIAHYQLKANLISKIPNSADKKTLSVSLERSEENFEKNIIKLMVLEDKAVQVLRKVARFDLSLRVKAFHVLKESVEIRELARLISVNQLSKLLNQMRPPISEERSWFEEMIVNSG